MFSLVVLAIASSGCHRVFGLGDVTLPIDAPECFGTGLVKLCFPAPPAGTFDVAATVTATFATPAMVCESGVGDLGWCVIAADSMQIDGLLRVTGSVPLVLVAATRLSVTGVIDVSSTDVELGAGGDDPRACASSLSGGPLSGGGAGGSFGGQGGRGGDDGSGGQGATAAPAETTISMLRGGCHGGNGASSGPSKGLGGGVVYLIAGGELQITGVLNASGGGGDLGPGGTTPGGGGGGGAGGMIGLDAPSIMVTGKVFANGGGGGGGGGNPSSGANGAAPTEPDQPALGGAGATITGGDGGNGAFGTTPTGTAGGVGQMTSGGGGGGGGAGVIVVYPMQTFGSNVAPPARSP